MQEIIPLLKEGPDLDGRGESITFLQRTLHVCMAAHVLTFLVPEFYLQCLLIWHIRVCSAILNSGSLRLT